MTTATATRFPSHLRAVIAVTTLGSFMTLLDTSIVNVALRELSVRMHSSLSSVQWVATGYLLAVAAVLPVSAWLGKRYGGRVVFVVGIGLFAAASLGCALAGSLGWLVALRVVQGLSGVVGPVSTALLVRAAGPELMTRAMAVMSIPMILGPTIGPTVGGLLLDHAGWQSIFLINVPIGAIAVILGLRLLPKDPPEPLTRPDLPGLGFVVGASVAVTYGLAAIGASGSASSRRVVVALAAGVLLIVLFVIRSLRVSRPILDLRLFTNRIYSASIITAFFLGAILFGSVILLPLYFQDVRGESALTTGLLLMPQGLGIIAAMRATAPIMERLGAGRTTLLGGGIAAVATVPFVLVTDHTSYWILGLATVVRGFGVGLTTIPSVSSAFGAAGPEKTAEASVQINMAQRIGGSLGAALFAVVLQRALTDSTSPGAAFGHTFWWTLWLVIATASPAVVLSRAERRAP